MLREAVTRALSPAVRALRTRASVCVAAAALVAAVVAIVPALAFAEPETVPGGGLPRS